MPPKKKRNPSGTKSNRKTRFSKSNPVSVPSHEQTPIEGNELDKKVEKTDRINTTLDASKSIEAVMAQESIDCPEHNEKENIDFEELISVSTINVGRIKINHEFMDSTLPLPKIHNKDSECDGAANEITSKLSSLNVVQEDVQNKNDQLKMIVDETGDNIFNDNIQEFIVECVPEELISVACEQEVESVATNENEVDLIIDSVISKDSEETPTDEKQETSATATLEKKPKSNKKSSKTTKAKSKSNNKKKIPPTTKTNKKEVTTKTKVKKPITKTTDNNESSDNSRRRSSRLKNISELKQNQTKSKTDNKLNKNSNDSDASDNSNSDPTDLEKVLMDSSSLLTSSNYENEQKPVKVKSRWRRSSELESVNNKNASAECYQKSEQDAEAEKILSNNEEIKKRLKQFVHLKENQYLTGRVTCKEAKKMACDCVLTSEEMEKGELGCGEDCLNRLLLIECGPLCPVSEKCTNKRFQKSQFSPSEVFRTDKKGLGIRATANILYGEFILEYVGEVIGPDEFEERATEYSKDKNPHYYFMSLRSDAVIDATQKGNISRFINHSCDPNAETQKWTVNGELRIGFFSKRTILEGEEITFDYQFQRYGKEAQKCFCESSLCRGWLGEEPEEDEEEEEEDEEEAVAETVVKQVIEKVVEEPKQQVLLEKQLPPTEVDDEQELPPVLEIAVLETNERAVTPTEPPPLIEIQTQPVKKEKKKVVKRKVLKDMFEDVDVDEELEMLVTTGLKNQAQTLKLSRLMVRATEVSQRITLLRVLRRGEFPCRRLFLDYHGLRLIHGWMNEAQQLCATDEKQEALRLGLLQTLVTLPIPNKTMLQDSKVLPTVELWSKKLVGVPPELDSESNSPKLDTECNIPEPTINKVEASSIVIVKKKEDGIKKESSEQDSDKLEEVFEIRKSVGMDIENIRSENLWREQEDNEKLIQDIIDMFDEDMDISPVAFNDEENDVKSKIVEPKQESRDYEFEIIKLAQKLLEEWSVLKEVFRIPKKERIEQMKEHEREADRGYKAGLEHYWERRSGSRYRSSQRSRSRRKLDDSYHNVQTRINKYDKYDKYERRKQFAMQVEQAEVERRFKSREVWRQPEVPCISMGNDGIFASPFDHSRNFQIVWNQQSGQWQTFPLLNPNMAPRFNLGMNFSYPITSNVATVNLGLPNITLPSQTISNAGPNVPPVPNLTNMSLPPPNLAHLQQNLHRPPIMTNSILGMTNTNQNSFPPVSNLSIPTNIPPPSTITLQTNIPPPTSIHPTNIPPPNMQQQPNILNNVNNSLSNMPSLPSLSNMPPLPNGPPPISNMNSHLSTQQSSFNMHQEKVLETEDVSQVKFAGPIPPPVKLPPKWKCVKDKYGRPYYYHIKMRISQWEPPELPPPPPDVEEESSDSSSSSDTSSISSSSSSEDSEEDEVDDTKLLLGIRKKFQSLDSNPKRLLSPQIDESPEDSKEQFDILAIDTKPLTLDERLKDEFELNKKESLSLEPPAKKKRLGLVTEVHIISPRTEEDKITAKENLKKYKENKEKLKRQKELALEQTKKRVKVTIKSSKSVRKHKSSSKTKIKETMDLNCETAKKIKETFRSNMAGVMVGILNPYRKADCKEGKITNTEDFKHLARKLTHFVMLKELKHCQNIEDLTCTESVKSKAKEFVRKYMSKFGETYNKPKDDLEY